MNRDYLQVTKVKIKITSMNEGGDLDTNLHIPLTCSLTVDFEYKTQEGGELCSCQIFADQANG